jgi:phage gpG-like protein
MEMNGLEKVRSDLRGMLDNAKDRQPLLEEAGRVMVLSYVPLVFRNEGEIDGHERWKELAQSTQNARLSKGSKILRGSSHILVSGRPAPMKDTITYVVESDNVRIGTNRVAKGGVPYPAVHQTGSRDGRVPKREFLFWTQKVLDKIARKWRLKVAGEQAGPLDLAGGA